MFWRAWWRCWRSVYYCIEDYYKRYGRYRECIITKNSGWHGYWFEALRHLYLPRHRSTVDVFSHNRCLARRIGDGVTGYCCCRCFSFLRVILRIWLFFCMRARATTVTAIVALEPEPSHINCSFFSSFFFLSIVTAVVAFKLCNGFKCKIKYDDCRARYRTPFTLYSVQRDEIQRALK